jgi:hypothetical protein
MSLSLYLYEIKEVDVFDNNITHNLGKMAKEAGIYEVLWRPEEIGIDKASDMIPFLEKGVETLKSDPERFKKFNPENRWGNYEGLLGFAVDTLAACKEHPDARVSASR